MTASSTVSLPDSRTREFEAVALPHLGAVARVARALARDEADADDLVQETYLRALRHWDTFQRGTDCRRWLSTICRNVFLAQKQRGQVVTAVENDVLEAYASADAHRLARASGLNDLFDRLDLGPAIRGAIAGLDVPFRDVVLLADIHDFTYEEIADLLMIPLGTVRSRLFRARRMLQLALVAHATDLGLARPSDRSTP